MYADDIKLNKIDNHVVWSDEDIGPNAREFVEYCMGGFQYSCNSIISNNTFKVTNCDLKNKDRNMANSIEHQDKEELVTNCDRF